MDLCGDHGVRVKRLKAQNLIYFKEFDLIISTLATDWRSDQREHIAELESGDPLFGYREDRLYVLQETGVYTILSGRVSRQENPFQSTCNMLMVGQMAITSTNELVGCLDMETSRVHYFVCNVTEQNIPFGACAFDDSIVLAYASSDTRIDVVRFVSKR